MCWIQRNKVLESKNYSQRIKMLLKMSARLDIERVCNLKNELKEIYSIVQKRRKIKSE